MIELSFDHISRPREVQIFVYCIICDYHLWCQIVNHCGQNTPERTYLTRDPYQSKRGSTTKMDFGNNNNNVGGGNGNANVDLMSWYVPLDRCSFPGKWSTLRPASWWFATKKSKFSWKLFRCSSCTDIYEYRYMKIPVVSRLYLTGAFMTTAACAVDIVSPLSLYFNYDLVFRHGQFWRLITPYLFFGVFSVDFLFHMYFLVGWWYVPANISHCIIANVPHVVSILLCIGTI